MLKVRSSRFVKFPFVVVALLLGAADASAQSGTRGSVPSIAPSATYSAPPAVYAPPASTYSAPMSSAPMSSAPMSSYQQMAPIGQSYPQYSSPSFSTAQPYSVAPQYYAPAQNYRMSSPAYYYRQSYQPQPLYQGYVYPSYRPAYGSSFAPSCR